MPYYKLDQEDNSRPADDATFTTTKRKDKPRKMNERKRFQKGTHDFQEMFALLDCMSVFDERCICVQCGSKQNIGNDASSGGRECVL